MFLSGSKRIRSGLRQSTWSAPTSLDGSDVSWPLSRLRALAYVVGVILKGDGSVYKTRLKSSRRRNDKYSGEFALRVSSIDFANHFSTQCAVVLGRKPTKVQGPHSDGCFVARYRAIAFYHWWDSLPLHMIRRIAKTFPRDYLRGRFDSESGVATYSIYMFGAANHRWVLQLDNRLCRMIGLRTGLILPYGRVGEKAYIHGRQITSKIQKLRFTVNATDFARELGGIAVPKRIARLHAMLHGRKWTPWSRVIRRRALALLRQGLTPLEVSRRIERSCGASLPPITIYFWERGTRSWRGYSSERFSKGVKTA